MNKPDKNQQRILDLLRGNTDSKSLDKSGYTSPLDNDTMRVKSTSIPAPEPVTRIKGMTDKIDTKSLQKVGNATDVAKANVDKVLRMKALRKLGGIVPGLSAVAALGSGLMSDNASASDIIQDVGKEVVMDLPPVEATSMVYEAGKIEGVGPKSGSFDDRLQKGQLTPEEMQMLRNQYLNK